MVDENPNRYEQIILAVFQKHYNRGSEVVEFSRADIERAARDQGVPPQNLGDILYTFRYRATLPHAIAKLAPPGMAWLIEGAGRGKYRFCLHQDLQITPNPLIAATKIPDATPGLISRYALSDEQALLAKLRYNRLIDIFTRVTCYSLQNHLRTTVGKMGQVETDEIYLGVDRNGTHYIMPVQAKAGRDRLNPVQIMQDIALCSEKFPHLVCRPIGTQFISNDLIALFEFTAQGDSVRLLQERHFSLVLSDDITREDLEEYRARFVPEL